MDHPLLARYLAGECSAAEAGDVQQWIAASPTNRRTFEQFQALWHASPTEAAWDVDAALAQVEQALRDRPPITLVQPTERPALKQVAATPRPWVAVAKVAAAVALMLGGVFAIRIAPFPRSRAVADAAIRTATTPRGQRASFRLADGTGVTLGPASTLRYPEAFGAHAREVTLVGEAYFEVPHDPRRPFIVRAGGAVATDLGTAFTVTAYPQDTGARVVVRGGLVGLRSAAAPAGTERVLAAGDMGRVGPNGELTVERADTNAQLAWIRGELVLPGVPLREAAVQLGRWYDVDVRLASADIGGRRLEASFEQEPVADVFRLIAASLELQVERAGNVYTLRAK